MSLTIFDNFNNVKIILDVPYDKKTTAKEYKARWSPDNKIWYIVHNNKCNDSRKCFGNINILTAFKIKEIKHNYYNQGSKEHDNLITYYDNLRKELRNKLYKCLCGCEYKFKHKDKHLYSREHLDYVENHENDDCDF